MWVLLVTRVHPESECAVERAICHVCVAYKMSIAGCKVLNKGRQAGLMARSYKIGLDLEHRPPEEGRMKLRMQLLVNLLPSCKNHATYLACRRCKIRLHNRSGLN